MSANNAFGLELFQRLRPSPLTNAVVAPASVYIALSLAHAGARAETAAAFAKTLHWTGEPSAQVSAASDLFRPADDGAGSAKLSAAAHLFGDQSYAFRPEYQATTRFDAETALTSVDFTNSAEAARATINAWVSQRTQDRIASFLGAGSVGPTTRLVLATALAFEGRWRTPFEASATRTDTFHPDGKAAYTTPTLHAQSKLRFANVKGVKLLELPYVGDRYALLLALPKASAGLSPLVSALSSTQLEDWEKALVSKTVAVSLPKFNLTPTSKAISSEVSKMGLEPAFDAARADFSGIVQLKPGQQRLFLDAIVHSATIEIDEVGTRAAASTAVLQSAGAAVEDEHKPEEFRADHPFLFFLRDTRTQAVLFAGIVADPASHSP